MKFLLLMPMEVLLMTILFIRNLYREIMEEDTAPEPAPPLADGTRRRVLEQYR